MKRCTVCLDRKEIEEFSENKTNKDGKMDRCKECNRRLVTNYYSKQYGSKEERESLQKELHNYILSLRTQGFQLKQISEATGLDQSSISYYISGKRRVGMNAVRKYAKHNASIMDGPNA